VIAALYVEPRGCYSAVEGVDLWDAQRDARLYAGPWPVVAHPPCTRWCRLAGLVEARWGYRRGDDGGCFAAALAAVRTWGGVLEHPAYSDAWNAFSLARPRRFGGWTRADLCGGYVCHVEQGRYGHQAKKATWLYAVGCELPELRWGSNPDRESEALVSWCGNHTKPRALVGRLHREQPRGEYDNRPRLSKRAAAATPPEFRDVLLAMAATARPQARTIETLPAPAPLDVQLSMWGSR
jgi:hypothetical protein